MKSQLHYENYDLKDLPGEFWADILGFEGYFQASTMGRIKSLPRQVSNGRGGYISVKGGILRQHLEKKTGILRISLKKNNHTTTFPVGSCVFYAFNPSKYEIREGHEVAHLNKIVCDNKLFNLRFVTCKESKAIDFKIHPDKYDHNTTRGKDRTKHYNSLTEKTCKKCEDTKPISEFYYGLNTCRKCQAKNDYVSKFGKLPTPLNMVRLTDINNKEVFEFIGLNNPECPLATATILKYAASGEICHPYRSKTRTRSFKVEVTKIDRWTKQPLTDEEVKQRTTKLTKKK